MWIPLWYYRMLVLCSSPIEDWKLTNLLCHGTLLMFVYFEACLILSLVKWILWKLNWRSTKIIIDVLRLYLVIHLRIWLNLFNLICSILSQCGPLGIFIKFTMFHVFDWLHICHVGCMLVLVLWYFGWIGPKVGSDQRFHVSCNLYTPRFLELQCRTLLFCHSRSTIR